MDQPVKPKAPSQRTDPSSETALYRLYDRDGALLYAGIAYIPAQRWTQHAQDKAWWPQVSRKTVQWFPNREAAEDAERAAIKAEKPRHNTLHAESNPGTPPPTRVNASTQPSTPAPREPVSLDLSWLWEVIDSAGAKMAPGGLGMAIAAVAGHKATALGQHIYDGPYARAAALAYTLGRLRWLDRANMTVAVATTVAFLEAAGRPVKPGRGELAALVAELRREESTTETVAAVLRAWLT